MSERNGPIIFRCDNVRRSAVRGLGRIARVQMMYHFLCPDDRAPLVPRLMHTGVRIKFDPCPVCRVDFYGPLVRELLPLRTLEEIERMEGGLAGP